MKSRHMFRRETIIALRARHQAYRIATDILHPHVDSPPPPEPPLPIDFPDWNVKAVRVARRMTLRVAAIVWGLVALFWILFWLNKGFD